MSVWVPERASSILDHLSEALEAQNRLQERQLGLFERQTLAFELPARSIDWLVSIQSQGTARFGSVLGSWDVDENEGEKENEDGEKDGDGEENEGVDR